MFLFVTYTINGYYKLIHKIMPLYMDYHVVPGITMEDAKKAHLKDLAMQAKYNVKYLQYWVNEEAGMVFYLIEGPDVESCIAIHRETNSNTKCNIIEVHGGLYSTFTTLAQSFEQEMVLNKPEQNKLHYQYILALDIFIPNIFHREINFNKLQPLQKSKEKAVEFITSYQGIIIPQMHNDSIIATFYSPKSILKCVKTIKKEFSKNIKKNKNHDWNSNFKMGISIVQPGTEKELELLNKAIEQSYRLCKIANNGEIITSITVCKLNLFCNKKIEKNTIKILNESEQDFINHLFNVVEGNYSDENFNVKILSQKIGVSRPHLYRKIRNITGVSPNKFIRDFRMNKAMFLIKQKKKNITEIALDVGMNNPSYFAKCFQHKYGILPSRVAI